MLMANMSVAGKIAAGLPEQALLRRHEAPIDRRLVSVQHLQTLWKATHALFTGRFRGSHGSFELGHGRQQCWRADGVVPASARS